MKKSLQRSLAPFLCLWLLGFLLLHTGCKREWISPQEGALRFSRDTVRFDSLFSTLLSPSQRLWVYNPHPYPVLIRRIRLERGERSPFRFIFDGIEGSQVESYLLAARDSAQVFIQLRDTTFRDDKRMDRLIFELGSNQQSVLLEATLLAAYVYRDFGFDSAEISLPSDKPLIIDGFFYVGPQGRLRILAGTQLYFSGRRWESGPLQGELMSGIYVAGSLEILGTPESPVQMQGWRLEPYYASAPGQWQGIWFFPSSQQNKLLYAEIRQSSIGIRIDSAGPSTAPKVYMEGCVIRDAANFGIVAQGFMPALPEQPILHAVNTLIYRCGQGCAVLAGGGHYRLIHCAFIYDQPDLRRGQTALLMTDFLRINGEQLTYPLIFYALNSVFWSVKEDAIGTDFRGGGVQWSFENCALRQREPLPGSANLYPASLGMGGAEEKYPLLEGSLLIDAGRYDPVLSPERDLRGRRRDAQPDIGVYEYLR